MPSNARYPIYTYSAGQWPQQLYYPQYWPQVPPHYIPYPAITPVGNPYPQLAYSDTGKRDKRRTNVRFFASSSPSSHYPAGSASPPPDVQTHILLGGRYKATSVWDISQDPSMARQVTPRGTLEPIPAEELDSPATDPGAYFMKIVCDLFPREWEIAIKVQRHEEVTVGLVLDHIFRALQHPLSPEEWEDETNNNRRRMHRAMCARMSRGPPEYELLGHVKRIDTLGDKTFFLGLKPVGPSYAPEEWLLKLGYPPKEKRR